MDNQTMEDPDGFNTSVSDFNSSELHNLTSVRSDDDQVRLPCIYQGFGLSLILQNTSCNRKFS